MLGMRIAALRRQRGMSQQDMAKKICVSPSAVGMYEQGRREPSLDRLLAMARLFDVSTDFLLTGVPHTQNDTDAAAQFLHALRRQVRVHRAGSTQALAEEDLQLLLQALLGA